MNAVTRIESAAERRAESRRKEILSSFGATLHAMIIETREIAMLGDADRAKRLETFRNRLALLDLRAGTLQRESQELADAAAKQDDDTEATG